MGKEVLIKGLNFSKTVATRRAASRLMVTMGGHSRMGGKTHAEGGSGGGIFARNREDPAPTARAYAAIGNDWHCGGFNAVRLKRPASLAIPPLLQQEGPVEPPAEGGHRAAARGQLHL